MAALVGDLAAAEEVKALKDLMTSFGVPNLDCRVDGSKTTGAPRENYLFNTTFAGVEAADVILLIGTNPRWEAPVLNARIRKSWLNGALRIANVGQAYDLTYPVEQLGASASVLEEIAAGTHPFAQVLRDAKRPMLILGQGALARADGAAIQNLAQRIAGSSGMIGPAGTPGEGGWNGFNVLHTAASRVGALDLGFLPVGNGRDTNAILDGTTKGDVEFVFLLGVDEIDMARLAGAFVVYQGTHGDAGAHRADVVFPGAAYTEKSGLYVNNEGRVQLAARATFPPGDAKEDWAILRALSDVAGRRLPYDDIDAVRRAILADAPHFATRDAAPAHKGADPAIWNVIGTAGSVDRQRPLMSPIADFYLTNPIARSSETMAECSRLFVQQPKMAAE
jgi:NADH-quinone oxidoreductase subunit G